MTPEVWQRLKPLYQEAMELPKENRPGFLAQACENDAALRGHLERLLERSEDDTEALDAPFVPFSTLLPPQEEHLPEGRVLLGRFKIVRILGFGGMGDVYEALDLTLQSGRIALKTIRRTLAVNPALISRLKEEVILARRVTGTHVSRIYEFFEPPLGDVSGCPAFLTMEYLDGPTLSDRISTQGPPSLQDALRIAGHICAALESIHEAHVVHRDLKPRNIMLVSRDGSERAVVTDFGLARAIVHSQAADPAGYSQPGVIVGTPEYMAPEQLEGREISPATDIYALGLVLYELITGQQPFAANTPIAAIIRRGKRIQPPSSIRRGVPPAWDEVIRKCLEFDAEHRYQSAREVIVSLRRPRWVIFRFPKGGSLSLTGQGMIALICSLLVAAGTIGWVLLRGTLADPLGSEAKKWYDKGLEDLNEGTYFEATKAFGMAAQLDKDYPLTHARLAESWTELDYGAEANKEILLATVLNHQRRLSDVDRKHIESIRSTILGDYPAAIDAYAFILKRLPTSQRPQGTMDLGRVYERAGRLNEALASYESVVTSDPTNASPYVRLGILRSRLRDPKGAEEAFRRAEELYAAGSNEEGLAEVKYQRGFAANESGDFDQARKILGELPASSQWKTNVLLQVRTLSQLSSTEYNSSPSDRPGEKRLHDAKAIEFANREKQLADENGLDYWSANSLMRLGNANLDAENFPQAEAALLSGLALAHKNNHPRLEALCHLSLASLYDQLGNRSIDQVIQAQQALQYFRQFQFLNQVDDALTLILRGQERQGFVAEGLKTASELLNAAEKAESKPYIQQAEVSVASLEMDQENYPAALPHFQRALQISHSIQNNEAYQALLYVNVLWRLGRYEEAESNLESIPADARGRIDISSSIASTRATMELSQGKYGSALMVAQSAIKSIRNIPFPREIELKGASAMAEAELGKSQQAQRTAEEVLDLANGEKDPGLIAWAQLTYAGVATKARLPQKARPMAELASRYFHSTGQRESEWLSLLWLARTSQELGDHTSAEKNAKQALDILHNFEQTWGSSVFHAYTARPDCKLAIQELSSMTGKIGR